MPEATATTTTASVEPTEAPTEPATPTLAPTEVVTTEPTATPTATPEPAQPTWTQLSPGGELPSPRRDHSLAADSAGGTVWLFAGRGAEGDLADLWAYDVAGNAWSRIEPAGDVPAARFGHNAAFDPNSNRMLVFGGQAGPNFFNDVWAYDPAANQWSLLADGAGPEPRYGAAGALDAGTGVFYVSHGFTNSGRFDDTWGFVVEGSSWLDDSPPEGPRPEARCLVRMASDTVRQRLLFFGGQSNTEGFKGDFWQFDIAALSWQELDIERPSPRNLYSFVSRLNVPGLVLFGGNSPNGVLNDLWTFDLEGNAWQPVAVEGTLPPARDSHDAAWLPGGQGMLVFGGRGGDLLNDLWLLTL
jgi:hypothetical protein